MNLHRLFRALSTVLLLASFITTAHAQTSPDQILRGGRVGWARLRTPDNYWSRHSETDDRLSSFIRLRTSLNIDPSWYTADVQNLDDLCTYPFIFANTLISVEASASRDNLAEYLKRGGFIVVDACINKNINPSPEKFLAGNIEMFHRLIPGCEVRPLPIDHEIFKCFFQMEETPPHTYHQAIYNARWAKLGLHGVFVGDRMVSLITLSGLQCGWSGVAASSRYHSTRCMEMMLNIYIYAMTR